jgi:hypothetical protein
MKEQFPLTHLGAFGGFDGGRLDGSPEIPLFVGWFGPELKTCSTTVLKELHCGH